MIKISCKLHNFWALFFILGLIAFGGACKNTQSRTEGSSLLADASCDETGISGLCSVDMPVGEGSLSFEVPDDASSLFLEMAHIDLDSYGATGKIDMKTIFAPTSQVIYRGAEDNSLYDQNLNPRSLDKISSLQSMIVPNFDHADVELGLNGSWRIELYDDKIPTSARLYYRKGAALEAGSLDVNIWLTGIAGITADEANDNPWFQEFVDALRQVFCSVDLELSINAFDINDPSFQYVSTVHGFSGSKSFYDLLFHMQEKTKDLEPALNLVLVGGFVVDNWVGWSWSPGPYLGGLAQGAAIAAIGNGPNQPRAAASVASHEMGHYLGLFHVSDEGVTQIYEDKIDDTLASDSHNLMYYTNHGLELTPAQKKVIFRHPLIKPFSSAFEDSPSATYCSGS